VYISWNEGVGGGMCLLRRRDVVVFEVFRNSTVRLIILTACYNMMVQSPGVSAVLQASYIRVTIYILTQYSTPYAHSGVVTGKNCMKLLQYAREKQVRIAVIEERDERS